MEVLRAFAITFSMFSKIPMPHVKWEDKNMKYAISFLPLVSVPIALLFGAWISLSSHFGFGSFLFAVGITMIPVLVTGGIHLDGFADTIDALSSHAPMERKKEILKDPHTGAFAIVGLCAYILIYAGFASELSIDNTTIIYISLCCFGSRLTGGMATLLLPSSKKDGLLTTFKSASHKGSIIVMIFLAVLFTVFLFYINARAGACIFIACILCYTYITLMSKRQFGGISGDLSGYIIQITELSLLAVTVFLQKVVII